MLNKIIYTIANILMVVEAAAFAFLVWAWRDAKRKQREAVLDNPPFARQLMPMGAVTYAIACSHCKNRGPKGNDKAAADRCHRCRCEIESGFEVDPATFKEWIPVIDRLPEKFGEHIVMIKGACEATTLWFDCWNEYWYQPEIEGGDGSRYEVTHWMPLPKPPKEVE